MAAINVTIQEAGLGAAFDAEVIQALISGVTGGVTITPGPYTALANIPQPLRDQMKIIFMMGVRSAQTQPGLALPSYTVVGLPAAAGNTGRMVYVSNESGGAVPAFSDGTNWRRVTDRAIVS